MTARRHGPGRYDWPDVSVHIIKGRKGPEDRLILWEAKRSPVNIKTLLFLIEVLAENEDRLYPPPHRGGDMLIHAIQRTREVGYLQAAEEYKVRTPDWDRPPPPPPQSTLWDERPLSPAEKEKRAIWGPK